MNIDYRVPLRYADDTRTQLLLRRVGANGISALYFLWHYTAAHHVSGILNSMNEETIEMAAKWFGKPGTLVPLLLELGWLGQMDNGTYFIPEWRETNSWAANADNRSAIGRLNGMATHYPELHQQLVEQGATGITADAYARITSEYNNRGIIQSSSIVTAEILQNLANCTTPAPAPAPAPSPSPVPKEKEDSAATAAADFSSTTGKTKTRSAKQRSTLPQAVATETAVLENIPISSEYPATAQAVVALWNARLAPAGFIQALTATPQRIKNFKSCAKYIPEAASMDFWHKVFDKILASEYMCSAAKEKAAWTSVDWILSVSNLAKVLEGKYDNDRKPKTTAKKETAQAATVKAETAPKPEQKPIELPAKISELHAKIQAMPELTLEEYLRLKFPEAEEEELHRDYLGEIHKKYYDFPQRWVFDMALEADKACATCTDPKHCKLPEKMKCAIRNHSEYLTVALCTNEHGEKYLGTKYGERIPCKHKCANCPSHVSEQAEKIPADVAEESTQHREAIPMPAKREELPKVADVTKPAERVDFASALGMRVNFDEKNDVVSSPVRKNAPKKDEWEADPYELEVIKREKEEAKAWEKYRQAMEFLRQTEEAEKAKAQVEEQISATSEAQARNTPEVPENTDGTGTVNANDADLWSDDEDEYRLYGDTGINGENEENEDADGDIHEEYTVEEAGDDGGDIAE